MNQRIKERFWNLKRGKGIAVLRRINEYFPDVENIKDAIEPMDIEVLPKDISKKAAKNHSQCALARACKRAKHLDGAVISRTRAFLIQGKTATRYVLPEYAVREIVSFDRGAAFEPGVYTFGRITPSELTSRPHNKPTGRKVRRAKHSHVTQNVRTSFASND